MAANLKLNSLPEANLNSLSEQVLKQKLASIEQKDKETRPVVRTAIEQSKKLRDISVPKHERTTQANLEEIESVRKIVLSDLGTKIKEKEDKLIDINREINSYSAEISRLKGILEILEQSQKRNTIVNRNILSELTCIIEMQEGRVIKIDELKMDVYIKYVQTYNEDVSKHLEKFKEEKNKILKQKEKFNVDLIHSMQRLDKLEKEYRERSAALIEETKKISDQNIQNGEKLLTTLDRTLNAALTYRRLRFGDDNLSPSRTPTPTGP